MIPVMDRGLVIGESGEIQQLVFPPFIRLNRRVLLHLLPI